MYSEFTLSHSLTYISSQHYIICMYIYCTKEEEIHSRIQICMVYAFQNDMKIGVHYNAYTFIVPRNNNMKQKKKEMRKLK